MGESNGLPQTMIELVAVDDHLLGVNSLDRAEPYGEIAGILDVDDQLGPAMGRPLRNWGAALIESGAVLGVLGSGCRMLIGNLVRGRGLLRWRRGLRAGAG
jgi:hypothetical protein